MFRILPAIGGSFVVVGIVVVVVVVFHAVVVPVVSVVVFGCGEVVFEWDMEPCDVVIRESDAVFVMSVVVVNASFVLLSICVVAKTVCDVTGADTVDVAEVVVVCCTGEVVESWVVIVGVLYLSVVVVVISVVVIC